MEVLNNRLGFKLNHSNRILLPSSSYRHTLSSPLGLSNKSSVNPKLPHTVIVDSLPISISEQQNRGNYTIQSPKPT